ncbi:MAG: DNA cytosine methyltransferase [Carboxydocellales bacterium]
MTPFREIIVDNFAGGGGASTGIELATGRSVDIAINHDPVAIALHKANHPGTEHYCESVWEVDPRKAVNGRPIALCWLSPDCKHFSKAKGGKPVEKKIRGLAWVAVRWAATVRPRVIMLENVEEFKTWGPLLKDGKPDPDKKGHTFQAFVKALKRQGYQVGWKELRACDYGAPTIRKRFFMVARCDGRPIVWPQPTHGHPDSPEVKTGKLKPWRTAAEIINWTLPCPSIFDTAEEIKNKHNIKAVRPLADNTLCRIAKGTQKFIINNPSPFIIPIAHYNGSTPTHSIREPLRTVTAYPKGGHFALATPFLTQYHSYDGDGARGQVLDRPLLTVDTNPRYALTAAFITKYYGTGEGSVLKEPLHTVTTKDRNALIETHLCVFRNHMDCKELGEPLPTVMTSPGHFAEVRTVLKKIVGNQDLGHWTEVRKLLNKYGDYNIADDEILLLEINGDLYFISDIGMRMLGPHELFAAQGFPDDYIIDRDAEGNKYPKSAQVARCGNAVPPPLAEHLVRANLPELCTDELKEASHG